MNRKLIINNQSVKTLVKSGYKTKDPKILIVTSDALNLAFNAKLKELDESPLSLLKHNARIRPVDSGRSNYVHIYIAADCNFTNNCPVKYHIELKKKPKEVYPIT
jgi:hypothetical protein